jgi:outer membrane protein OmpA-like peptidoglycan-associated protein
VTPVPVAAPVPVDGPVPLPDSAVGFLPDQAVLRDPTQAAAVLAPFAERLRAGAVHAVVTGTTSSAGTPEGRLALSRDRAAAVADLLRRGGAPEGSVQVRGVGAEFPGFVPDRDPRGALDPVLAARNRQVIIELVPRSI